ncbi:MAG: flippase-like domain-containing protein [Deltaproteobacteria bacterium]|nr:flippase-like domain-containing protein [Deltaproteobacteria bacterium]
MSGWAAALRARWLTILIGALVGAFALTVALWGVPLGEVATAISGADPLILALTGAMFLLQQAIRAWRQAVILRAGHPGVSLRTSLSVLCVSFFVINSLPARLGELARPLLLAERAGVPIGGGLALMVVERIIDLCAMCAMLAALPLVVPPGVLDLRVGEVQFELHGLARTAGVIGLPAALIGLLLGLRVAAPAWARLGPRLPISGRAGRIAAPIRRVGADFAAAASAVADPGRLAAVLGLTLLTWTTTAAMYPLLAVAFGVNDRVGLAEGFGLLGVVMASLALPAAPGFAGTYEAFLRAGLGLFGVGGPAPTGAAGLSGDAVALAYALTMHWWVHLVQASSAVYFLVVDRISPRRLLDALARALAGDGPGDGAS